jgi:transcriptional regulator with XRE-family HTH domain
MTNDWATRIRSWRKRSGLTQEAVADLFMVDERTVRRWEQGISEPPLDVRRRLERTSVPLIQRPEISALAQVIASSALGTMLLDENLKVLAMSERERQFWLHQTGKDLTGGTWEPYIPSFFQEILEGYGGWRAAIKAGASSLTGDCRITLAGDGAVFTGRIQYTILRMSDGTVVHSYLGRSMPETAVLLPARVTFIDEIMQAG